MAVVRTPKVMVSIARPKAEITSVPVARESGIASAEIRVVRKPPRKRARITTTSEGHRGPLQASGEAFESPGPGVVPVVGHGIRVAGIPLLGGIVRMPVRQCPPQLRDLALVLAKQEDHRQQMMHRAAQGGHRPRTTSRRQGGNSLFGMDV